MALAVKGAIPLADASMHTAIGGLLAILQAIDRRDQNKADLDTLTSRLDRLSSHLHIGAGTTIVMRVFVEQETRSPSEVDYQCYFCGAVNHLAVGSVMYSTH